MNADPKRVTAWLILLIVPIATGAALVMMTSIIPLESIISIVTKHFAVAIGLPMAALVAAFIVIGLQFTEGPITFKGLGFEFEGAAGQVILWVICFLAISLAIKLLWGLG